MSEISELVGFDCAWYGWAELVPDNVKVCASATHNLAGEYFSAWSEISDQDLLAARLRKVPLRPATYNRAGNVQTEGMVSHTDGFGLHKMATAMHIRPGRVAWFFLSGYRGSKHSDDWSGDRLPGCLCNLLEQPGEHVLFDHELIVRCEEASQDYDLGLRKLTVRPLTRFDLLTFREKEVAQILANGKSHKETARIPGVAPATIRNRTQSIYSKLLADNRAGLTAEVQRHRWVGTEGWDKSAPFKRVNEK